MDKEMMDRENLIECDAAELDAYLEKVALNTLSREIDRLDPEKPTFVLCQSGYRSSLGTSIFENAGFQKIYNVVGGTKSWMDAGLDSKVSETACAFSK